MPHLRSKSLLLVLAGLIAIAGTAAPGAAKKAKKAAPVPVASGSVAPGYYLMSGSQIVSKQYANLGDCYKDLALIKHRMEPGSDTLVCAHRTQ